MSDPRTPDQKRFAGGLQVTLGVLMTVLCGGCTLAFWTGLVSGPPHSGPYATVSAKIVLGLISLAFGVLPTAVGGYLVWLGVRDLRAARAPSK